MATKYRRYLAGFGSKQNEKAAICKDIELKFGIESNFGPLSSKTNINFQSDVNSTSL